MARRLNRSKKTRKPADDEVNDDPEEVEDDEEEEAEEKPRRRRSTKKKATRKKRAKKDEPEDNEDEDEDEDEEDDEGDDEPEQKPARRSKRKPKAKKNELAAPQSAEVAELFDGVAGELGSFEDDERLGSSESFPYLAFYADRMNRAGEVEDQLGELDAGHPILHAGGGEWYDADGLDVMILAHFPYWCTLDQGTHQPDEISVTPQPFDPDPEGFKKNVLAIVLVLSGGKEDIDEDLAPAIVTLTTFRSTRTGIVEKHVGAVRKTTQSGWAKKGGEMEKHLMSWPKNYRIASGIVIKTKPSKRRKGRTYTVGEARPHVLTIDQAKAVKEFLSDQDCRDQLDEIKVAFEQQIAELRARAEE